MGPIRGLKITPRIEKAILLDDQMRRSVDEPESLTQLKNQHITKLKWQWMGHNKLYFSDLWLVEPTDVGGT